MRRLIQRWPRLPKEKWVLAPNYEAGTTGAGGVGRTNAPDFNLQLSTFNLQRVAN